MTVVAVAVVACDPLADEASGGASGGDASSRPAMAASGTTTGTPTLGGCRRLFSAVPAVAGDGDWIEVDVEAQCVLPVATAGTSIAMNATRTLVVGAGDTADVFDLTAGDQLHQEIFLGGGSHAAVSSGAIGTLAVVGRVADLESGDDQLCAFLGHPTFDVAFRFDNVIDDAPTLLDAAITPEDVLRTWHRIGANRGTVFQTDLDLKTLRTPTIATMIAPGDVGRLRVALGPVGQSVLFNATPGGELLAKVVDTVRVVRGAGTRAVTDFRAAPPPLDTLGGPAYAVSILDDEGVHVAVADVAEILVDGTAPEEPTCRGPVPDPVNGCTETCEARRAYVVPRGHAIARLPDGDMAVVHVKKEIDVRVAHAPSPDGTRCDRVVWEGEAHHTLTATRVTRSGVTSEHLHVALGRFPDPEEGTGDPLDIAAFDDELGISVRHEDAHGWKLRIVRVALGPG